MTAHHYSRKFAPAYVIVLAIMVGIVGMIAVPTDSLSALGNVCDVSLFTVEPKPGVDNTLTATWSIIVTGPSTNSSDKGFIVSGRPANGDWDSHYFHPADEWVGNMWIQRQRSVNVKGSYDITDLNPMEYEVQVWNSRSAGDRHSCLMDPSDFKRATPTGASRTNKWKPNPYRGIKSLTHAPYSPNWSTAETEMDALNAGLDIPDIAHPTMGAMLPVLKVTEGTTAFYYLKVNTRPTSDVRITPHVFKKVRNSRFRPDLFNLPTLKISECIPNSDTAYFNPNDPADCNYATPKESIIVNGDNWLYRHRVEVTLASNNRHNTLPGKVNVLNVADSEDKNYCSSPEVGSINGHPVQRDFNGLSCTDGELAAKTTGVFHTFNPRVVVILQDDGLTSSGQNEPPLGVIPNPNPPEETPTPTPEPEPVPEPAPDSGLSDIVIAYDANDDGIITCDEANAALEDVNLGLISTEEYFEVEDAFIAGGEQGDCSKTTR